MTREEMIEQLEKQNGKDWVAERESDIPILEEVIKTMQTEPCEDAIDRQAVLDIIHHYKNDRDSQLSDLTDGVCNLPSVQLEQKVIRCKDCKYLWECGKYLLCDRTIHNFQVEEDGFCAWAKMKEGERMEKYCPSCRHYPNDEHCHGCVWDSKTQRNTHWEPKEPFINKPCVSEQACHEDKMKVLEKIKAEIENIKKVKKDLLVTCGDEYTKTMMKSEILGIETVLLVVDKHMAESEES